MYGGSVLAAHVHLLASWFHAACMCEYVQVMWNTKLLAKGKKVNREFAFISYSTPDEAATAIQWMHNAYIEGLTKDRDGLTVQYEAQGAGKGSSHNTATAHLIASAAMAIQSTMV